MFLNVCFTLKGWYQPCSSVQLDACGCCCTGFSLVLSCTSELFYFNLFTPRFSLFVAAIVLSVEDIVQCWLCAEKSGDVLCALTSLMAVSSHPKGLTLSLSHYWSCFLSGQWSGEILCLITEELFSAPKVEAVFVKWRFGARNMFSGWFQWSALLRVFWCKMSLSALPGRNLHFHSVWLKQSKCTSLFSLCLMTVSPPACFIADMVMVSHHGLRNTRGQTHPQLQLHLKEGILSLLTLCN